MGIVPEKRRIRRIVVFVLIHLVNQHFFLFKYLSYGINEDKTGFIVPPSIIIGNAQTIFFCVVLSREARPFLYKGVFE